MIMTHYMELLASNQPWNLLIFMVVPVVLAETIAITELYLLFTRNFGTWVKKLSRYAGIIAGLYFLGVTLYLGATAVLPLTSGGLWRGPADVIAVLMYLSGVIPLLAITFLELGILGKQMTEEVRIKWHATWVGVFLVVAHIAMIFGMLNPTILGYHASDEMNMMDGEEMMMDESDMMDEGSMGMMMDGMMHGLEGKSGAEFEEKFLEEMIMHHEGAIDMAKELLKNTNRPELLQLANDIVVAQEGEIQKMRTWLTLWFK